MVLATINLSLSRWIVNRQPFPMHMSPATHVSRVGKKQGALRCNKLMCRAGKDR